VNLQYNEMRRNFVYWTKKLTATGLIDRLKADGKFKSDPVLNGWDEVPEKEMYNSWHHQGRRFRHGAEMMGADFTQWHGVWEMQFSMVEMITWAAEKGDKEAEDWVNSNHPSKFIPYALYDIPGSAWGINVMADTTPFVYSYEDYWDRIKANVEAAYNNGFLAKDQWELWLDRYENREHYSGLKYVDDPKVQELWNMYKARNVIDTETFKEKAVKLKLPGKPFYPDN